MRSNLLALSAAASVLLLAGAVWGQGSGSGSGAGSGSGTSVAPKAEASPSTKAFMAAREKLHKQMAITLTGDADIDFVKGMIPHHQGAVDMAKIVLEHGKDADVRKLAQDVIKAQEAEIAWMTEWLKMRGK